MGAIFGRITGKYGMPGSEHYSVRPSTDFPDLPQPSTDLATLQRDFIKFGYCLVKDALSQEEVEQATERLLDQAEAERTCKVAQMGARKNNGEAWGGSRQLVSNLSSKGDIWRKIATYESNNGHLVGELMHSILGKGLLLSSMHGVIVEQHSGAQGMHQDQAFPLPHPPFPTHSNIIYMYTPWSLENGGTYVIPGTATDGHGNNIITEDTDAEEFLASHKYLSLANISLRPAGFPIHKLIWLSRYGIVALCGPPGTCFVSDGRLLHAGAPRTAPGVRLGNNVYHCRAQMKQQENPYVSYCGPMGDEASPKLMQMLFGGNGEVGFGQAHRRSSGMVPVGELSMSRPEEFDQDFDFYYTGQAKALAQETDGETALYRGPADGEADDMAAVNDQGGVVEASKKGESAKL